MELLSLPVGESRIATAVFRAADGSETDVEAGSLIWSSSPAGIVSITVDPTNEKKATVTALAEGVVQVNAQGDADVGAAERLLTGVAQITVTPGAM